MPGRKHATAAGARGLTAAKCYRDAVKRSRLPVQPVNIFTAITVIAIRGKDEKATVGAKSKRRVSGRTCLRICYSSLPIINSHDAAAEGKPAAERQVASVGTHCS